MLKIYPLGVIFPGSRMYNIWKKSIKNQSFKQFLQQMTRVVKASLLLKIDPIGLSAPAQEAI